MRQMLLGLPHAHARGVMHRDLKLSNVMLIEMTGTENLVKLLDFGLARISGVDEELSLTEGMVAGTPSYMSPEQALGKKTDHRTDIYSAGVILYVLCTGKRPFAADDTTALLRMQIDDPPPPPRRDGARQAHQRGARARDPARAREEAGRSLPERDRVSRARSTTPRRGRRR